MDVGILGSGEVGRALATGFTARGHKVTIGTRDPHSPKLEEFKAAVGERGCTGSFEDAARFGEVVVLATRWDGTENALRLAGAQNLAGKVVIDVTNPLDHSTTPPGLALGHTDSGGEQVQRWLPGARVVKAFNIITAHAMVDPQFPGGPPDMFICGDDEEAKQAARSILESFGWNVIDIGGITGARLLEPLAVLWITHGFRTNTWGHAFKLLKKGET